MAIPSSGYMGNGIAALASVTAWVALTPSDGADISGTYRWLYVAVGGAVTLTVITGPGTTADITRTFYDGQTIPGACVKYVKATGITSGMQIDGWP